LQDLGQLFPPESMGALEQAVNATVAGGDFGELELELRTGSGGGRWLLVRAEAQRDAAGRVVCLHGTMQDITERKRVREQLEHDAAEIEDLYQNAPCGYHSIDGEGRFCRINDTELAWLGYSRSEVVGRLLITDILTPKSQQRFRDTFPGMKQAGYVRDVELDMISRNGEILPVLINATAILGADGRFLMTRSMVLNMKDRKGMEEVRQRQADRLAKLSRRLISVQEDERRRLSTELHDRTSPNLAALDINLRSLGRRLPPDPDSDAAMLLDDARALLADTADNIRDVCADLRPPILDYAGVVPALQSYAQQFAARTGIAVDVSVPERASRLDSEVESTVFRIAQESLTNCAKHARAGRISVVLNVQDRRLDLEIADDGVGFAADAVGEGESAPGLGLLSMQERAQFVGGSLLVSSAPGQGTRIVLSIPLARAPEKALVNQPEPVSPASWWLPGGGQLIDTQIPG
jgi:PAS domain S-box-containing protein